MKKNPFKKSSVIDTVINVGIGGAANVAMNYVFGLIPADTFGENATTWKNAIKIGVGAIGGSMVSGEYAKYLRPAFDGIATVGASELISGLIASDDAPAGGEGAGRVPFIGRAKYMGQRGYRKVAGAGNVGNVPFMG